MKLQFIPLGNLVVSKTNMRFAKKAPDVTDILPSVRARGVIQPILVRQMGNADLFEIVAGARRFTAARIVAGERRAAGEEVEPMPCAVLDGGDDADAVEASLIENLARLDADEVTQWTTFTRLVKEGRSLDEVAATFGLPEARVRQVLALGNLLPRIRGLYGRGEIDRATVRLLTMATKRQQTEWLELVDDKTARAPMGHALKAWLTGGQSIPATFALFDVAASGLAVVADLFGEDRYFADPAAFWTAQEAAIDARREAYLAAGWSVVTVLPRGEYFCEWEHEKTPKAKGGGVFVAVRSSGEVTFHEGYVTRKAAARNAKGEGAATDKPKRAEITAACQTYVDLHRHAAVRAALTDAPAVALRLMVAHVLAGSPLWTVRHEAQASRDEGTIESIANSVGEARFGACRMAVLALLDLPTDSPELVRCSGDGHRFGVLFHRLLDLPDEAVLDVIAVAMGETLMAGSVAVEAAGAALRLDMADWWEADAAFLDLVRDKEVLHAMVAEVAGRTVADANAKETGKTLRRIVADHLAGAGGRDKVTGWVPGWLAFPPAAYTGRGGVANVRAARIAALTRASGDSPDPDDTSGAGAEPTGMAASDATDSAVGREESDGGGLPLAA